jgi:hypothetical protein
LHSAISSSRDEQLCSVTTANITGAGPRADYEVKLYARHRHGGTGRLIREAEIKNWPRNARPAWRLVAEAFKALSV